MIYVDSNYWIYWLDSRLPEHRYVRRVMREAVLRGAAMNYVTLLEVAHYLRRLPRDDLIQTVNRIGSLSTLTMVELDHQISKACLDLLPDKSPLGLGARDCVVIATMKLLGIRKIATHDQAFRGVEEIEVVDTIPARRE